MPQSCTVQWRIQDGGIWGNAPPPPLCGGALSLFVPLPLPDPGSAPAVASAQILKGRPCCYDMCQLQNTSLEYFQAFHTT